MHCEGGRLWVFTVSVAALLAIPAGTEKLLPWHLDPLLAGILKSS